MGKLQFLKQHIHCMKTLRRQDSTSNMGLAAKEKILFVTVGTTLFDALIEAATTEMALDWMTETGYTKLILQYGKGPKPTLPEKYCSSNNTRPGMLLIEMYTFKSSLEDDMKRADLILSHAGAGTIMEVLRLQGKRLAVVINIKLMDNHQTELAHAMRTRGYLYVVDEPSLLLHGISSWKALDDFVPVSYSSGNDHDFSRILDQFMGFAKGD